MDNVSDLLKEIDAEDWNEEGNRKIALAAKMIDGLDDSFPEDIEALGEFFDENSFSPSIMRRMLEKKVRIIKHIPDGPNHKPLSLFKSQRERLKKELLKE